METFPNFVILGTKVVIISYRKQHNITVCLLVIVEVPHIVLK